MDRHELWRRFNVVVEYWTPLEPATADYYMCQFFILYENEQELARAAEIAEQTMREDQQERQGGGAGEP